MKSMITYKLTENAINPRYFGLIRERMPDNYDVNIYNEIPTAISTIVKYFSGETCVLNNVELQDCFKSNLALNTIFFKDLNLDERTMLYFFFCVECDEDADVVFSIESHAKQRLWLNGKMVFLCGHKQRQFHTLNLVKGKNVFCLQQHDSVPVINTTIRIRLLKADQNDDISITQNNLYYQEGQIGVSVRYLDEFLFNGEDFHFVLYPIDCVILSDDTQIHMQIVDHVTNTTLYEQKCRFHEFYSVPTKDLHYISDSIFNYLDIKFNYHTIYGDIKEVQTKLYLSEPKNFVKPVQKYAKYLLNHICSDEEKCYLEYIINLKNEPINIDTFHKWERISKVVSIIDNGQYGSYIRSQGEKVVCFHSDIDDTIDYYTITLPRNYSINKKYPLIVINNVLHGDWLSSYLSRAKNIEAIAVDFSGKGVTMGSYIGDASFNEIYKDVFSKYSVDENKVLMMGHSNGGYATWAQAQATPDRYSAIFPAVSEPNKNTLTNLFNMDVRYFTSESDYLDAKVTNDLEDIAKNIRDYKTYRIEKFNHGLMGTVQFNEKIIDELLQFTRNEFPNEVYFTTDKNRYLKAYWVRIHSICSAKKLAKVHAKVEENQISITVENITGITVTIPPQVDKKLGAVIINNDIFSIEGKDKIIFIVQNGKFILSDTEQKGDIYLGTGLIDPFITPVRIISFLGDDKEEILNKFRSPATNGFYGGTSVNYPVLDIQSLAIFPEQSLVVLDNCTGNGEITDTIRNAAPIKTDINGYIYQDEQQSGDYLVMQIVSHPTRNECSILYINTNNEELYNKCFFTRNLILPAYANGYHEYLNSYALIYSDGKYTVLSL